MTEEEFVKGTNDTLTALDVKFQVTNLHTSLDLMSSMILANKLKVEQISYYDETALKILNEYKLYTSLAVKESVFLYKMVADVIIDEKKYPEFIRYIYNQFAQKMKDKQTHFQLFEKLAKNLEACKNFEKMYYENLRADGAEVLEIRAKKF